MINNILVRISHQNTLHHFKDTGIDVLRSVRAFFLFSYQYIRYYYISFQFLWLGGTDMVLLTKMIVWRKTLLKWNRILSNEDFIARYKNIYSSKMRFVHIRDCAQYQRSSMVCDNVPHYLNIGNKYRHSGIVMVYLCTDIYLYMCIHTSRYNCGTIIWLTNQLCNWGFLIDWSLFSSRYIFLQ